jgi:DNA-directed RNA polymerase specialized sigma24 family protein
MTVCTPPLKASKPAERKGSSSSDQERLIAALDCVPEQGRLVYLLAAVHDLNYAEIAFLLRITTRQVERHFAEALFMLTNILNE